MSSITQILNSINTFSATNFLFSQLLDVFWLVKNVPETVSSKISTDDFVNHLSQAQTNLD